MKKLYYIDSPKDWDQADVRYIEKTLRSLKYEENTEIGGKGGGAGLFDLLKYYVGLLLGGDTIFIYLTRLTFDAVLVGAVTRIYKKLSTGKSSDGSVFFRTARRFIKRQRTLEIDDGRIGIIFSLDEDYETVKKAITQLKLVLSGLNIRRGQSVQLVQSGDRWIVWWNDQN